MLSEVAICNSALAKLGGQFIIDLADGSKASRSCNECFGRVRDALLRAHRWSFAMKSDTLASIYSNIPIIGYGLRYQLPADLLRLDYVGDFFVGLDMTDYRNGSLSDYKIEGRTLVTNLPAPLSIRYVYQCTDTTRWDPLFDEAMAAKMAVEMAVSLTQSNDMRDQAQKDFHNTLLTAIRVNAIEKAPEPLPDDSWMMSRL